MLASLLKKFFPSKSERDLKELQPFVTKVQEIYPSINALSNDDLRKRTSEMRKKIADYIADEQKEVNEIKDKINSGLIDIDQSESYYKEIESLEKTITKKIEEILEELLPEAFAVLKDTARRYKENPFIEVTANDFDKEIAVKNNYVTIVDNKARWSNTWDAAGTPVTWDMVHYDVQLIGGTVIHQGKIAEMATGEGKTLVATLPVFLNALPGRGVHLVTVNNYLSRRDSEWMGPLMEFHGLRVDCIDKHQPNSEERRKAYQADITYGTNNEFGFDYLRDNMASHPSELVQRKLNFAIVDEVDSVLVDDARTPLIISGPTPKEDRHLFVEMKPRVEKLVEAQKKYLNTALADAKKLIAEKKEKEGGLALLRCHRGLPKNKALIKFLSEPGIKQILEKTENFYMQDQNKEMHIVDAELLFVIEEKNNSVELTEKGTEMIAGSDDINFFIIPDIGSHIAEIEKSNLADTDKLQRKEELYAEFTVKSERIHTINQLLKAYTLFEIDIEYVVMDGKIKIVDEQTGRILDGRRYSDGLHQAIESKENVKIEAATQTYATVTLQNYFRMYNKLAGMTGTAETEAKEFYDIYKLDVVVIPTNRPISRKDHADFIYKTAREKYNAVIEEIERLNQAGRPVLVGTTSVEISELLSRMLKMRKIKHNVLNAKLHQKEAEIVAEAGQPGAVTIATNMAGRGTDIKITAEVKASGGLAIIGTERHESRRVDRQLRGRAGRQGDPGSSQFYVSLEDNLMRLFGSGNIAKTMDKLGFKEGEVIQSGMITRAIENAQRKVEENNFGIRKRLLEYDDVMNSQREVVYKKRRNALFGEKIDIEITDMLYDVTASIVNEHSPVKDFEGFVFDLFRYLGIQSPIQEEQFKKMDAPAIIDVVFEASFNHYKQKLAQISEQVYPVVKNVFETEGHKFENILIPFTDNLKGMQVVTNLKKAFETQGRDVLKSLEKSVILGNIDLAWKEHLREMDELKQSVQNAVYEQKDPLLIYKFESLELFKKMLEKVNKEIVSFLSKAHLPVQNNEAPEIQQARELPKAAPKLTTSRTDATQQATADNQQAMQESAPRPKPQPIRVDDKIGRNDPCPCGSGKKYKQCHGSNAVDAE